MSIRHQYSLCFISSVHNHRNFPPDLAMAMLQQYVMSATRWVAFTGGCCMYPAKGITGTNADCRVQFDLNALYVTLYT